MVTADELSALQIAATTSGVLSAICSVIVIRSIGLAIFRRRADARSRARVSTQWLQSRAPPVRHAAVAERLVLALSVCDVIASVSFAIGEAGTHDPALCIAQAWGIHLGSLGSVGYASALSVDIWLSAALERPQLSAQLEPTYHLLVWLVALPLAGAAHPYFGGALLWCWVTDSAAQAWTFYGVVIGGYALNGVLMGGAVRGLRALYAGGATHVLQPRRVAFGRQSKQILAFMFVWAFGIANRLLIWGGHVSFHAALLHVLFVPLWGFLNALIYVHDYFNRARLGDLAAAQARADRQQRVRRAIESVLTVKFPVSFMPFPAFASVGSLISHEEARDRHMLRPILDSHEQCVQFVRTHATVFFSHQWTGFGDPDPTRAQYELMVRSALELCAAENIRPRDLFVWTDFHSVPQANPYLQALSVGTLGVYASLCEYFVVVAPPVEHAQLGVRCDLESYKGRGWCRLEQWAHLTAAGTARMFIVTGDGGEGAPLLRPVARPSGALAAADGDGAEGGGAEGGGAEGARESRAEGRASRAGGAEPAARTSSALLNDWLAASIRVFDGAFTVPDDKPKLVDVVLGLWALTLVAREAGHVHATELMGVVHSHALAVFPPEYFLDLVELLEEEVRQQYAWHARRHAQPEASAGTPQDEGGAAAAERDAAAPRQQPPPAAGAQGATPAEAAGEPTGDAPALADAPVAEAETASAAAPLSVGARVAELAEDVEDELLKLRAGLGLVRTPSESPGAPPHAPLGPADDDDGVGGFKPRPKAYGIAPAELGAGGGTDGAEAGGAMQNAAAAAAQANSGGGAAGGAGVLGGLLSGSPPPPHRSALETRSVSRLNEVVVLASATGPRGARPQLAPIGPPTPMEALSQLWQGCADRVASDRARQAAALASSPGRRWPSPQRRLVALSPRTKTRGRQLFARSKTAPVASVLEGAREAATSLGPDSVP